MPTNVRRKRSRLSLPILVPLALSVLPAATRATDFTEEQTASAEFISYCRDYYRKEQCDNALRFVLKTYGVSYIIEMHMNEDPQSFLESLRKAVAAGEALKASEPPKIEARD